MENAYMRVYWCLISGRYKSILLDTRLTSIVIDYNLSINIENQWKSNGQFL